MPRGYPSSAMSAPQTSVQGPVLIAGGAGYIGSHTVRLFQQRGIPVVVVDNLSTGHRDAVTCDFVQADLGDRAALDALFAARRPRAVVHFAAKAYVGESVGDPAKYYRENVVATFTLLEAMRAAGCGEIVFSSTCATYGNPVRVPIDEDHPQNPISPYGRTKLHIEHMLEDYSRAYGLRFAALRYFNAAGAAVDAALGERHDPETHIIPLVLDVAAGRRIGTSFCGGQHHPQAFQTGDNQFWGGLCRGRGHLAHEHQCHQIYLDRPQPVGVPYFFQFFFSLQRFQSSSGGLEGVRDYPGLSIGCFPAHIGSRERSSKSEHRHDPCRHLRWGPTHAECIPDDSERELSLVRTL